MTARPETVPNPAEYFDSFLPKRDRIVEVMEQRAREEDIPIIGPAMGHFLCTLLKACGARRVLELGTAIGYSTIWLARGVQPKGGKVTTIEREAALVKEAEGYFRKARVDEAVHAVCGAAAEVVPRMVDSFDAAFLDIEKSEYLPVLPAVLRVLRPGGLLLADNGSFADSDPFNRHIVQNPNLEPVFLYGRWSGHSPDNDCLILCRRK